MTSSPGRGSTTTPARGADLESLLAQGTNALLREGNLHESRHRFEQAYRLAEERNDVEAMAVAVLGLGGLWVHEHRSTTTAAQLRARLTHVLPLVDVDSSLGLRLRARLAGETDYGAGTQGAIVGVLDEARAAGDPVALADALSLALHCMLGPDDGDRRRALAEELIGVSAVTGRRGDLLMGLLWQTVNLFLTDDRHAERRLGELRAVLAEEAHLAVAFVVSAMDTMLAIRTGRFDEAEALAAACAERGEAAGDIDATGFYGGQLFAIRWYQGRVQELLPLLLELVNSPTLSKADNSYFAALAVAAATAGDRRTAVSALAKLDGAGLGDLTRSSTWLVTMNGVIEAAHLLDDADIAGRAYRLIEGYADLPVVASLGAACFGSVHQALGLAALTMNDLDRAVDHFGLAVQRNLALAHWPAVISSRWRHATALQQRRRPGDDEAARRQLAKAREEAASLGLTLPKETRPAPANQSVVITRDARRWRVDLGGRSATVEHSVGMLHLAVLASSPGVEIPAIDLVTGVGTLSARASPQLDRTAIASFRQRLADLRDEITELETRGRTDEAERVRAERARLVEELTDSPVDPRAAPPTDSGERARLSVGKAIRRALDRIEEADPVIGEHLRGSIHTGLRCLYSPVQLA